MDFFSKSFDKVDRRILTYKRMKNISSSSFGIVLFLFFGKHHDVKKLLQTIRKERLFCIYKDYGIYFIWKAEIYNAFMVLPKHTRR